MQFFFLIFLVALTVTIWGRSRFQKIYLQEIGNFLSSGVTGAELAERILEQRGISGVEIVKGWGILEDYYDPRRRRIGLAPRHFQSCSYAALAIAAQQAGKVIQHYEGHRPMWWRHQSVSWTVHLSLPLLLAVAVTLLLGMNKTLFPLTLLAWSLVVGWNLMTIPTELDAGERAKRVLSETGLLRTLDERVGVERVMGAFATAQLDGVTMLLAWAKRRLMPWVKDQMAP
jgi:uncharacterized protein